MKKVSAQQIKKIHVTAKELGFDRETLYSIVWNAVKSDSISKLTVQEGIEVINALLAHQKGRKAERPGMASDEQLALINGLIKDLGWDDDPMRLRGYLLKYAHVDDKAFLTGLQASKIINGLKAQRKRLSNSPEKNAGKMTKKVL